MKSIIDEMLLEQEEQKKYYSVWDSDQSLADRAIWLAENDAEIADYGGDPIPMEFAEFQLAVKGDDDFSIDEVTDQLYELYLEKFKELVGEYTDENETIDEAFDSLIPVGKQFEIIISRPGCPEDIVQKSEIMDLHALDDNVTDKFINKAKDLINAAKKRGTDLKKYGVQVVKNTVKAAKKNNYNHYDPNETKTVVDSVLFSTGYDTTSKK